jgi:hypothetical protein
VAYLVENTTILILHQPFFSNSPYAINVGLVVVIFVFETCQTRDCPMAGRWRDSKPFKPSGSSQVPSTQITSLVGGSASVTCLITMGINSARSNRKNTAIERDAIDEMVFLASLEDINNS